MSVVRNEIEAATNESLTRIQSHPFIVSAHRGTLSRNQGLRWIKCAGRESRSFPTILENMLDFVEDPIIRDILKENLDDEYGNGNPEHAHFKHYLQLIDNCGIDREEFYAYKEGPGILYALNLAYNISKSRNAGLAIGYMLVNEGMTPLTYEAARSALLPFFSQLKTTFFDMHIEVDAHHVEELFKAVDQMKVSELDDLRFGVLIGERGMAALLDEAYGVFDFIEELPLDRVA